MDMNASWEVWATRIISAASVAVLGYFLLFVDFSSHGRVWDMLAARVPVLAKIIPPAAASTATFVVKSAPASEQVVDRTLIMAEPAAQQAAVPAPAAVAAALAPEKRTPTPRLTTSLTGFDVHSSPSQTNAAMDAAPAAAQTASAAAPAAAAQPQSAPAPAIAAKASYGAASRSEMMGQAAGPVYNFKGKKK